MFEPVKYLHCIDLASLRDINCTAVNWTSIPRLWIAKVHTASWRRPSLPSSPSEGAASAVYARVVSSDSEPVGEGSRRFPGSDGKARVGPGPAGGHPDTSGESALTFLLPPLELSLLVLRDYTFSQPEPRRRHHPLPCTRWGATGCSHWLQSSWFWQKSFAKRFLQMKTHHIWLPTITAR